MGSMATASGAFSQPPGVGMGAVMLTNPQVQSPGVDMGAVMLTNPQGQSPGVGMGVVMLTNPQVQYSMYSQLPAHGRCLLVA